MAIERISVLGQRSLLRSAQAPSEQFKQERYIAETPGSQITGRNEGIHSQPGFQLLKISASLMPCPTLSLFISKSKSRLSLAG